MTTAASVPTPTFDFDALVEAAIAAEGAFYERTGDEANRFESIVRAVLREMIDWLDTRAETVRLDPNRDRHSKAIASGALEILAAELRVLVARR